MLALFLRNRSNDRVDLICENLYNQKVNQILKAQIDSYHFVINILSIQIEMTGSPTVNLKNHRSGSIIKKAKLDIKKIEHQTGNLEIYIERESKLELMKKLELENVSSLQESM